MPIFKGITEKTNVKLGDKQIKNVYKGTVPIWSFFTPISATGGTITNIGDYRYHAFTSTGSSTFTVNNVGTLSQVEYLIVGGGGESGNGRGGGGGAGGLLTNVFASPLSINEQNYTITVGAGGCCTSGDIDNVLSVNGGNSSAFGLTAIGGGGGGRSRANQTGRAGGSGGGGGIEDSGSSSGGVGTSGQGNNGGGGFALSRGAAGGGGGAGGSGGTATSSQGGNGGVGINLSAYFPNWGTNSSNTLTGTRGWFAGGGGGGVDQRNESKTPGSGGIGGGGNGGGTAFPGTAGLPNTGGGGASDGCCNTIRESRPGGSGIVIIRYRINP